jgi:hypothetical protein
MKKTEHILNGLYEVSEEYSLQLCITLNPDKAIIEQAMQETAVQFAEWREYKHCAFNTETKLWYIFGVDNKGYTTKELFKLFNNEK